MASAGLPKPSRSDEHSDLDEQLRVSRLVREQFDDLAPKRPLKPSRSDLVDALLVESATLDEIPEYSKLQSLSALSEPLVRGFSGDPAEEFVETEYYKDLNSVDKTMHHTIGTGFIQIERNGVAEMKLTSTGLVRTKSSCNPGTNDWIPSPDPVFPSSDKPGRSDP